MRLGVAVVAICLAVVGVSAAQNAAAAMNRKPTNIPAQPLSSALEALAKERDLQVIYRSDIVQSIQSAGAVGVLTPEETLTKLLSGTGLTYRYLNETTVTITPASTGSAPGAPTSQPSSAPPPISSSQKESANSGAFLLAQTTSGQAASAAPVEQQPSSEKNREFLQEVIVTAQKREQRLQDVPIPVTAVSADSLTENNQVRLQDYISQLPAVTLTPGLFGQPFLIIRGITTGDSSSANPTVGVTIDDVPYGASTGLAGGGFGVPDIDPSDLARVEVLRGPQGTLYGASSMGGLLKFVTLDPSTDGISGHIQAGGSVVQNGAETGYSLRGGINVPLADTVAVRVSGFVRQDPGYIDNTQTDQQGVNKGIATGGHASLLWKPSDSLSVKLGALVQSTKTDGQPYIDPTLGDLKQAFVLPDLPTRDDSDVFDAIVTAKLGPATLTAVSGYNINKVHTVADYTPFIDSSLNQQVFGVSGTGTSFIVDNKTDKFSQEVRLSTPIASRVDLLLGGFYTHEYSTTLDSVYAVVPATGAQVGHWVDFAWPVGYAEYALFGDLTFHFTERFNVQVGGRESHLNQTYSEVDTGPLVGGQVITPEVVTKDNSFTYLVTPQFTFSPHLMAYGRLASGYRPGGPNADSGLTNGTYIPPQFSPDKTQNYEVGVKGDALDHALTVDASLYYIDWKSIQIQLREPISRNVYYVNEGQAKSQGLEVSAEARPLGSLTVSAWAAWNDAKLTQAFPPTTEVTGASGDRLPFSARFSGNLSINDEFFLTNSLAGFVGASVSYVGDRTGVFTASTRQDLPAYTQVGLNTGAKYEQWLLTLYVRNLSDQRGILNGGMGGLYSNMFTYIQPRTIGLTVSRGF